MKRLHRAVLSALLAFGCILALKDSAAIAAPRPTANRVVIYVDDGPDNNGSVRCPPTGVHTLDDAKSATGTTMANVTWYVCPGEYDAPAQPILFSNHTNLKIAGKGVSVIIAPPGYTGTVFYVSDSANVTIQGLAIDGRGQLGMSSGAAIIYDNSSGTIKGNTISRWHTTYSGPPPVVIGASNGPFHSIAVIGNGDSTKKLQILNNTIYDSQDVGILVANLPAPVKIVKNRVVFSSAIIPVFMPAHTVTIQAGIALVNSGPGSMISGNQVTSSAGLYPTASNFSRGIMVYGTSGTKVIGNTVRGTAAQISIENWCNKVGITANNNLISGNRLYDTWAAGVYITARNDQVFPPHLDCGDTPHADFNQVKGNTIYALAFTDPSSTYGQYGVSLETVGGLLSNTVVGGNTIAGFGSSNSIFFHQPADVPGTVLSKNKLLDAPPAGVYK